MRPSIINIFLPEYMTNDFQLAYKKGQISSMSAFFRFLWREWKIHQLAKKLRKQEKEFDAGKGIKLRSLSDLD